MNILSVLFCSLGTFLSFHSVVSSLMFKVVPLPMSILVKISSTEIGYTGLLLFPILNIKDSSSLEFPSEAHWL